MMWSDHGGWDADRWLVMSVMMIVFWGLVVALVVSLIHRGSVGRTGTTSPNAKSADRVLAERFARGDIDQGEYTREQATLRAQSRP
jgi:putative membrane protein